jgi:hypothetical protein
MDLQLKRRGEYTDLFEGSSDSFSLGCLMAQRNQQAAREVTDMERRPKLQKLARTVVGMIRATPNTSSI